MRKFLRDALEDHFIFGCITLIIVGLFAALTALILTGHDQQVFRILSLCAQGFVGIVVLFGLNRTTVTAKKNNEILRNGLHKDITEIKDTVSAYVEEQGNGR